MNKGGRYSTVALTAFVAAFFAARFASGALSVKNDGDFLRFAAPQLRFINGRALNRLQDGSAVLFVAQLSVSTDNFATIRRRSFDRFVISYDLWEEKFAVSQIKADRRNITNLTAAAAEAWCMDQLRMPVSGLETDTNLWVRLDLRAEDPRLSPSLLSPPLSLARLIELFSRAGRDETQRWSVQEGPFRLADLKR